ncbi:MAG: sodium-translocating pyrophosphatase [Candidatus Diapherotrites archaeon]
MVLLYVFGAGILGLIIAAVLMFKVKSENAGTPEMQEISSHIREGAFAYLKRQYSVLLIFVIIVTLVLAMFIGTLTAISFVFGAFCSALAGFIGMNTATLANVRTAAAAKNSLPNALKIAFSSGAVLSMFAVSIGLLGISILYMFVGDPAIIFGFGFGASSVALFARVGGGIYTKAADVGADLVGKVEAGIPEDDPRNPAVIADNVGDNVGDVAGMGADLFESYVGSLIAAMALGVLVLGVNGLMLPLAIAAIGIVASLLGIIYTFMTASGNVSGSLRNGTIISALLVIIGAYLVITKVFFLELNVFWPIILGLAAGLGIGFLTEYYTSDHFGPTRKVSASAQSGAAINIIEGLSLGMKSTTLPVLFIAVAMFGAYHFAGVYGIALAGVGMLSTLGITLAVDAYGPVADNAGGIAEMAKLGKAVRDRTDALDAAGNTTAAMGKGFAIGSAALTALALFSTYAVTTNLQVINIMDSTVMIGLLVGAMLPFLFASFAMDAVGKTAEEMITEVRRQFKEIKGLMEGKAKADYKKCIEIATNAAIKQMIVPGLMAILVPIAFGLLLGPAAVGGLLAGALVSGVVLAIMMANSGGAWDNAKKYIEKGAFGGKGSPAHKAAVVGDTVGDPMKDTAGPSINILLKLMSIVAVIFAVLFM